MGQMIPTTESWATKKMKGDEKNKKSRYFYLLQVYVQFYICQGNEEWIYLFYLFIFWDMKDSCFISKRPPLRFHPVKPFDGPRGIFDKDPPLTKHQFSLLPENMYCGYLLYTGLGDYTDHRKARYWIAKVWPHKGTVRILLNFSYFINWEV